MNEKQALSFGIAAVLLWSTVATAFKIALGYFTALQLLTIASGVSALALIFIAGYQGKLVRLLATFRRAPGYYLAMGAINPLAYYLILFQAYELLPASQAQPLNYSWAITLTVMSALFLGQRISTVDWLSCGFGYLGVVVIATRGELLALSFDSPKGVALALLSTVLWAGYWILNTRNHADPVLSMLLTFLLAWPLCVGLSLYQDQWQPVAWQGWLAAGYIGLFEMGISFVLWLKALKMTNHTARLSNLIFISPFISLVLIAVFIGETIQLSTVTGLILIVTGLLIQQWQTPAGNRVNAAPPP